MWASPLAPRDAAVLAVAAASAAVMTLHLVPQYAPKLLAAGLGGVDLNKARPGVEARRLPESLGLVAAVSFVIAAFVLAAYEPLGLAPRSPSGAQATASLLAIVASILLGFADDVLNFRWRVKLVIPAATALVLALSYAGPTGVALPLPALVPAGPGLRLGPLTLGLRTLALPLPRPLFVLLVGALIIFSTNSINIYAGINGIEVGQATLLALALLQLVLQCPSAAPASAVRAAVTLLVLFAAVSAALLHFNRCPARGFVGDTYCYFAGMVLVAAALLAQQHVALLTLALPQLANFALSLPQLLGLVPCPRHRLPRLDPATGRLVSCWPHPEPGHPPHMTLINLWLRLRGPLTEARCCAELLLLQALLAEAALALLAPRFRAV